MEMRHFSNLPERVQIFFEDEGMTRQSFADECDINLIMAKYQTTGAIDHFARHEPRYGFADGVTFHDAMNIVAEGDSMFADLPSKLRSRFENPGAFLDFVQDEANAEEMVELGLRAPVAAPESPKARVEEPPPVGELPTEEASEAAVAAASASD